MPDTVTTNAPQAPNAMGGAPTTTQNVDGEIQPRDVSQPTQPTQPTQSTQPTTPAQPNAPAQPVRPAQPQQPPTARGLHSSIFDGVLKTLGGGTQYINKTDPTTGETTQVPIQQSRGQLGKSIIAGAIAGMFGGMGARDAEGRHDPMKAGQEGFVAGQQPMAKRVSALQQTSDEDISRRQMVMKNNLDLVHQQIAMTHQAHADLQETSDRNTAGILADAANYDKNLAGADVNDPTKKALIGQKMTYEQALAALKGHWSDQNAIVDGYQDIRNPETGQMETHPTYAILNPAVSVKMSEAQAKEFAQFKPAYANAYQATGGNLNIPLHRYAADMNQLNSLKQTQAFFEQEKDALGIKNTPDFAAIARKGGQPVLDAVKDVENALAQNGDATAALKRLTGTGGGALILKEMGISNQQVDDLFNKKLAAQKLAEQGGMGDKAPAQQTQVDALVKSITDNPDMTDSDKKALMVDVPSPDKDGVIHMNQGQVAKVVARQDAVIATNKGIAEKNSLANGDPVQMQKTASNIIEGDIDNITKIASMRGNARINTFTALHDEAVARGLDPTDYSEAAMTAKDAAVTSYAAAGKIGQQITSFRTFLGHEAEAVAANDAWTRMDSPLLNQPMAWLAKNATNDPNYVRLKAAIGAPLKEYMSFLNAGHAEQESDTRMMDRVTDINSTPLQINTALKEWAKTADFRLGSLGKGYQATVGTNFTGLLDPSSKATLVKLVGPTATSPAYAAPLPKGWAAGKAQQMTDKNMARTYLQAAGMDTQRATDLAKKNGWVLNFTK